MPRQKGSENIVDLIATRFAAFPDLPAIEFEGRRYGRAELAERSDRIACWLLRHGCNSESLVGIYMDRSMEMLVALLAVIKAGAAYVPLDPAFPRARNENILEDTRLSVLLTQARHQGEFPSQGLHLLAIDSAAEALAQEPIRVLPEITAEQRAYTIFTSGSTGRPKGVEVTHGAVVNLLNDLEHRLAMTPKDRLVAVTTLAFDISVLELLLPLVCGGTIILATAADAADGVALSKLLVSTGSTALQATPFTWRMLVDSGFRPSAGFKMMCGGEAWLPSLADQLLTTGGRLWNMYGPTETTVWSSVTEVLPGDNRITLGPPIANTRFYVLDGDLRPVPAGEPGELCIAGAGLARGYLNRPELTSERFVPEPLATKGRMYRTGDQVRELPGGHLQYLGRSDQQVKFRGFRIELGEIESAIRDFPGVRDAVAVLREDGVGEPMLAGYFLAEPNLHPGKLRDALQQQLPGYMVPRVLLQLQAFPLTSNGKTDRRALLGAEWLPAKSLPAQGDDLSLDSPPPGTVEQQVQHIWETLFPGEVLTADSDFFALGGDSLLLLKFQSLATRQLDVNLTLGDVYRYPTLGSFLRWIQESRAGAVSSSNTSSLNRRLLPLQTAGSGKPVFLLPQMILYETLAAGLGDTQPVYALELLQDDVASDTEKNDFEKLAQLYYNVIREVQPTGPYRIGGWCMWGWVAYELGRLMERSGEEVDLVILMDAWAPMYWHAQPVGRKLLLVLATRGYRLRWFADRLWKSDMQQRVSDVSRRLQNAGLSVFNLLLRKEKPRSLVQKVLSRALLPYAGGPLKGRVILFKGDHQPRGSVFEEDLGWSKVVGHPIAVSTLPGNHAEIFNENGALSMAAELREMFDLQPTSKQSQGEPGIFQAARPTRG